MTLAGAGMQPPALVSLALLRARLCQDVALARGRVSEDACFMAGLFSVLDALLGVSMADALERIPLHDDLNEHC